MLFRSEGVFRHSVVVHRGFETRRQPPLDLRESRWLLAESPRHLSLFARALGAVVETRRRCRRERWDVIHAHSRGGFAVVVLLSMLPGRIPLVFTNHAFARRTGMYRWAAGRRRLATVVLNPAMAAHYGLTPEPGRVEIVPDCCADSFFEGPLVHRPGPRPRLALVGVGNLVRWKKWNLVLDALGRLPIPLRQRVHFTLWGPTPADPDSQAFARELKAQVGSLGLAPYVRLAGPTQQVREAVEAGVCCGSAGIYNLVQPEVAAELGRLKADDLAGSGAAIAVSANIGCSLQIRRHLHEAGHTLPVEHPMQLLARSAGLDGSAAT